MCQPGGSDQTKITTSHVMVRAVEKIEAEAPLEKLLPQKLSERDCQQGSPSCRGGI